MVFDSFTQYSPISLVGNALGSALGMSSGGSQDSPIPPIMGGGIATFAAPIITNSQQFNEIYNNPSSILQPPKKEEYQRYIQDLGVPIPQGPDLYQQQKQKEQQQKQQQQQQVQQPKQPQQQQYNQLQQIQNPQTKKNNTFILIFGVIVMILIFK